MRQMFATILAGVAAFSILHATSATPQAPMDADAMARSLLSEGKVTEAESILRNHLVLEPAAAESHFLLGYVLFREKKPKESLAEFSEGSKTRHLRADEFKIVASDYILLDDLGDADKWFTEVVKQAPQDAEAWYLLGRTKYNENDFAAANASFEHALSLRPKYVEAENNLGLSLQESKDLEKAKQAFQTAIGWEGERPQDAQPYLNLGAILADQGQADKAIPYLLKAETLSPENPKIHEQLGAAYSSMHDLVKAQSELEKATLLAPDISALHFKLGQLYRKQGLAEQAQKEFDICAKLNSTHSSAKTPNPPSVNTDHP